MSTPDVVNLLQWFAEGERPHKFEWLDAEGRQLAEVNLRSPHFKHKLPAREAADADMVRLTKCVGKGLVGRRFAIEHWRAAQPYFTAGFVNVTGLALIKAGQPPREQRQRHAPRAPQYGGVRR